MGAFLGAIFGGSNPTLNGDIHSFGNVGGFSNQTGQKDVSSASNFWNGLLSGNMAKISQLLAPQISAIQKQAGQQKKTTAMFGNRGGGTNASMQHVDDRARANIDDMISKLTGQAPSNLGSLGTNMLNTSLNAYSNQAEGAQMRMQNWLNSVLGKGISDAVGTAEGFGLGKAFPAVKS